MDPYAETLITWFCLWFVFALWCVDIARKKGRSQLGWFVAGMVFGLFALVAIALLGPATRPVVAQPEPVPPGQLAQAVDVVPAPVAAPAASAQPVSDSVTAPGRSGSAQPEASTSPQPAPRLAGDTRWACQRCNYARNPAGAVRCYNCGAPKVAIGQTQGPAATAVPAASVPVVAQALPPAFTGSVWSPTHVVPAGGMAAWDGPDPSRPPVARLSERVELIVLARAGALDSRGRPQPISSSWVWLTLRLS
jgi:hypothetical protein